MLAIALVACSKKENDGVVRIGHVAPFSGSDAHLAEDNESGARMAIDELNAAGTVIGGKKVKFELLTEDDAGDPKKGTWVAQKLVEKEISGVIGHLNSGTTIPASRIYADAGIPQISPSVTNTKYTRQGFRTTFRIVADDAHLGGALGRYAVNTLKAKSIAVVDDRTVYGKGIAEEFIKAVQAAGGKIVTKEAINDKTTDFTAILTTIKAINPDLVFFGGMDSVAGPMLAQMKTMNMHLKFMGGDGICTTALPRLSGNAMTDGQVYCAEAGGVDSVLGKPVMDKFKADFKEKYNKDVEVYSPYVYDSVKVMAAAMVKAKSSDPEKYLSELAKTTDYQGITGPISFDEKGDIKNAALTLKVYKSGKAQTLAVVR